MSTHSTKEDWLAWLEAIATAAESKEQLHSMVDEAISEFVKDADAGQRAQFAEALRARQHSVGYSASTVEMSRWADWPAVVEMAIAKLEGGKLGAPGEDVGDVEAIRNQQASTDEKATRRRAKLTQEVKDDSGQSDLDPQEDLVDKATGKTVDDLLK